MIVKLLFFGATAETVGLRRTEIEFPSNTYACDALQSIKSAYPKLEASHDALLFSINQEYANGNELIADGDELAIFTPVSGG